MPIMNRDFICGMAVGTLGLVVGASYLLSAGGNGLQTKDVVLGVSCLLLATGYLVRVLVSRTKKDTAE